MQPLAPNQIISNRYLLIRPLGYGAFSEVWLANDQQAHMQVALKAFLRQDSEGVNLCRHEFEKTYHLNNQYILKPDHFGVFEHRPYLILKYCEKGNIQKLKGKLSEHQLAKLILHIATALDYIHNQIANPILHADIKPDNILIDDNGDFLLADFGISTDLQSKLTQTKDSSDLTERTNFKNPGETAIQFKAPELFTSAHRKQTKPTTATDIWSFGATVYEMATGNLPFLFSGGIEQHHGAVAADLPHPFSKDCNKLIIKCLSLETKERPTAKDLQIAADLFIKTKKWKKKKEQPSIGLYISGLIAIFLIGIICFGNYISTKSGQSQTPDKHIIEPTMVIVKGGTYLMGSYDFPEEKPVHSVTLKDFAIGQYEVTQAQWKAIMNNNPSHFQDCDNCPVESVSWNDVQEFITKLDSITGNKYRLPTEAEWEYAARGGNKSLGYLYAGSNYPNEVAEYKDNNKLKTKPVGSRKPNELGIFDMSGNVWEWCSDWYDSYPGNSKISDCTNCRVIRGGSWLVKSTGCRVSARFYQAPENRVSRIGFRLAYSL